MVNPEIYTHILNKHQFGSRFFEYEGPVSILRVSSSGIDLKFASCSGITEPQLEKVKNAIVSYTKYSAFSESSSC